MASAIVSDLSAGFGEGENLVFRCQLIPEVVSDGEKGQAIGPLFVVFASEIDNEVGDGVDRFPGTEQANEVFVLDDRDVLFEALA